MSPAGPKIVGSPRYDVEPLAHRCQQSFALWRQFDASRSGPNQLATEPMFEIADVHQSITCCGTLGKMTILVLE